MRSALIVSALFVLLPLSSLPMGAAWPVGESLVIRAEELDGPDAAAAVRVQATDVWGVAISGCVRSLDPTKPIGIAVQVFSVLPSRMVYAWAPEDTNLGDEPALGAFMSAVMSYDPREDDVPMVFAHLPPSDPLDPSLDEGEDVWTMCFGDHEALAQPTWGFDAVIVVAFQNAAPDVSAVHVTLVGASHLDRVWEAEGADAAHFVRSWDMSGPIVVANGLPGVGSGGAQVGGMLQAEVAQGAYGSLGYLWGTSDGAYAVRGPEFTYPACADAGRNTCPASVLPAEQFAGAAGSYEFVHLASRGTFHHGLVAFWADLPLPDGIVAPAKISV